MGEPQRGRIKESTYRGWNAFEIESKKIKLIMIPELGGKIVSIVYKTTAKEWLIDPGTRELSPAVYGSDFIAADMSGWDECFPTIISCPYPTEGAYKGIWIPDHGELWTIPWQAYIQDDMLFAKVKGRQLPYEFSRKMYFLSDHTLRLEYNVMNLSNETLSVLWSAHPQFVSTEHTQIRLPLGIARLLCVDGGRSLEAGRIYDWPQGNGSLPHRLDRIGPATSKDCRKFYVEGQVPEGWVALFERNNGNYLKLEWLPETVPYLGIWIDEGMFNEQAVCAVEPCNGYYDNLSEASSRGLTLLVEPNDKKGWYLDISVGCDQDYFEQNEGAKSHRLYPNNSTRPSKSFRKGLSEHISEACGAFTRDF